MPSCSASAGSRLVPGEASITEHAAQATRDWKQYSLYAGAAVGAIGVIEIFLHLSHHEEPVSDGQDGGTCHLHGRRITLDNSMG